MSRLTKPGGPGRSVAARRLLIPAAVIVALLAAAGVAASAARPDPHLSGPVYARTPGQYVVPQATALTGDKSKAVPNKKGPSKVVEPWNVDGCDHDYGTPNECVPWVVPGKTTAARCTWLLAEGFKPFKVYGRDRQDLNPAHTALACSAADLKVGAA
ncbi:hypothetical protein KDL01_29980 [Actinospica durhamensis]|uniref:Uncharacterized protein n=1 Tax=Actinospica durhamensis TaxID=1508375 RepID=A0A941EV52_9ACTN|nr:hypothetical protein [Actinospica durhamensis]MBR7837546.1 hypothetical protein [Actinospica durhamensis]